MQALGRYVLEAPDMTHAEASHVFDSISSQLAAWLAEKGFVGRSTTTFADGRSASLEEAVLENSVGRLRSLKIVEEIRGGSFETAIDLVREGNHVTVSCTIAAGQSGRVIAPLAVDARCPAVITTLVEAGAWCLGPTKLSVAPLTAKGADSGRMLAGVIRQGTRSLPIVVVSSRYGLLLHRDLPKRLARALCGLALVTVIDDDAAWSLTQELTKPYSCFNGAIRLYWPGFSTSDNILDHPLWTAERILERAGDVESAVARVCGMLRKRLMATSVVSLAPPQSIAAIRRAADEERFAALRKQADDDADYKALADSYAEDVRRLEAERDEGRSQLTELRQQLYRLQTSSAWADAPEDLESTELGDPTSVAEAVDRARRLYAPSLVFGSDVTRGVSDLAEDAGPPAKVFAYLGKLSEMAMARRGGSLGTGMLLWLAENNVTASAESDTTLNNRAAMKSRTWNDGSGPRAFNLHLKPNDGVQPDRCVRIYFDWNNATEQIVVGWIGRHP